MAYTQELIDEVKELFPNSPIMIKMAEEGSVFLGRYLDDSISNFISTNEVLLATSLDELKEEATLRKRKVDLYRKWCEQDPRRY